MPQRPFRSLTTNPGWLLHARVCLAQVPAAHDSAGEPHITAEQTEIGIGAGALLARHRVHTLAEARQRTELTQAQVARRMNVRQERISAIERAESGAVEVRTLAAYVAALGGRLEIIAHIDGERITLSNRP